MEEEDGEGEEDGDLGEAIEEDEGDVGGGDWLVLGDGVEEPEGLHVGDDGPDDEGGFVEDGWLEEEGVAGEWGAGDFEWFFADLLDDDAVVIDGGDDEGGLIADVFGGCEGWIEGGEGWGDEPDS